MARPKAIITIAKGHLRKRKPVYSIESDDDEEEEEKKAKDEVSEQKDVEKHAASNSNLECPLCFNVFHIPHILNCGHTFCKMCIKQLAKKGEVLPKSKDITNLKCPLCSQISAKIAKNFFAMNILADHVVSCDRIRDWDITGCKWEGTHNEYLDHKKKCAYLRYHCKNAECTFLARNKQKVLKHENEACMFALLVCPLCKVGVKRMDSNNHPNTCSRKIIGCPHADCKDTFERKDIEAHVARCRHCLWELAKQTCSIAGCVLSSQLGVTNAPKAPAITPDDLMVKDMRFVLPVAAPSMAGVLNILEPTEVFPCEISIVCDNTSKHPSAFVSNFIRHEDLRKFQWNVSCYASVELVYQEFSQLEGAHFIAIEVRHTRREMPKMLEQVPQCRVSSCSMKITKIRACGHEECSADIFYLSEMDDEAKRRIQIGFLEKYDHGEGVKFLVKYLTFMPLGSRLLIHGNVAKLHEMIKTSEKIVCADE